MWEILTLDFIFVPCMEIFGYLPYWWVIRVFEHGTIITIVYIYIYICTQSRYMYSGISIIETNSDIQCSQISEFSNNGLNTPFWQLNLVHIKKISGIDMRIYMFMHRSYMFMFLVNHKLFRIFSRMKLHYLCASGLLYNVYLEIRVHVLSWK